MADFFLKVSFKFNQIKIKSLYSTRLVISKLTVQIHSHQLHLPTVLDQFPKSTSLRFIFSIIEKISYFFNQSFILTKQIIAFNQIIECQQQVHINQSLINEMVDRQHRPGARTGSVGVSSYQDANVERRERVRKLALETIDISKDPYFMRNHIGTYECRLCLTLHSNQGSYLAHTQGKKHQTNLARRVAREARDAVIAPQTNEKKQKLRTVKIGKPIYRFKKQQDQKTNQKSILFQIQYPQIQPNTKPQYRFMSAYEQKIQAPDNNFQYILFAAQPYVTIAFKIPNMDLDTSEGKFYESWDVQRKIYIMCLSFKE